MTENLRSGAFKRAAESATAKDRIAQYCAAMLALAEFLFILIYEFG